MQESQLVETRRSDRHRSKRQLPRYGAGAKAGSARRLWKVSAIFTAALLFLGTMFGLAWLRLQGNIQVAPDIDNLLDDRPSSSGPLDPNAGQPINLLVIGSDVRTGEWADKNIEGMRSDATMLLHISADRKRVDAVSLPRDMRLNIPSCTLRDGSTTKTASNRKFNEAFSRGGMAGNVDEAAACTIKTIEGFSDIYIDDYIVVNFAGFENMVEALDGVPLYVDEDIADKRADLYIDKGCRLLDGHNALGYARARYSLGDGSDISRIDRQQRLISAIVREALSLNLLTNLPSLYQFLDAATQSLSTGPKIGSLSTMAGLAYSLRSIDPAQVTFVTLPFAFQDKEIYFDAAASKQIFENIKNDRPLGYTEETEAPAEPSASPTSEPSATPTQTPTPTPEPTLEDSRTAADTDDAPECTRKNAS
ncbi:MAG: LCP family protein [Bowdeniella nasicola]|nr:LCP family protein [Bowdeniella nasicola]